MQENRVRIFFKNFNFDLNSNRYYVFLIAGISFILDSSLHHFFVISAKWLPLYCLIALLCLSAPPSIHFFKQKEK